MDSSPRSNLSVGMPLDVLSCRNNSIDGVDNHRIEEGDGYFQMICERWSAALPEAQRSILRRTGWMAPRRSASTPDP